VNSELIKEGERVTMTDDDDPRIVGVELLPGSLAVWRAINNEDPAVYPIRLRLS
jgi:hypothetical protein